MSPINPSAERRRRLLTRVVPLIVVSVVAFAIGIAVGAGPDAPAAARFLTAWEAGDYEAMYSEITPGAQDEVTLEEFTRAYEDARTTATIATLAAGEVRDQGDAARSQINFETHIFGSLGGELALPIEDGLIAWKPELVYPGLADGERLTRRTRAPPRAAIRAADGSPLAQGPAAARTIAPSAIAIAGEVSSPNKAQADELTAEGFPRARSPERPDSSSPSTSASQDNRVGSCSPRPPPRRARSAAAASSPRRCRCPESRCAPPSTLTSRKRR